MNIKQHKAMTWIGWILTTILTLLLAFSATMKFLSPPDMAKEVERLGYPDGVMFTIGIVEIACALLYFFPRTAILGAVLLTGYLGGATATHVRIDDPFFGPIMIGVLVWLALFLRDPRVRAILPWRGPLASEPTSST